MQIFVVRVCGLRAIASRFCLMDDLGVLLLQAAKRRAVEWIKVSHLFTAMQIRNSANQSANPTERLEGHGLIE